MEDDILVLEAEPVEEPEDEVTEVPVTPDAPQIDERAVAIKYLQENEDEFRNLAKVAQRMYPESPRPEAPQGGQGPVKPVFPDHNAFGSWEEYHDAVRDYNEKNDAYNDARLAAVVHGVRAEYAPVTSTVAVTKAVDQIVSEAKLPESAKSFLAAQLQGMNAAQIEALDPQSKNLLVLAAKGAALEAGTLPVGRNGRQLTPSEPIAGVGPMQVKLAQGVSKGELNAYLEMTGKTLTKDVISHLQSEGYLEK